LAGILLFQALKELMVTGFLRQQVVNLVFLLASVQWISVGVNVSAPLNGGSGFFIATSGSNVATRPQVRGNVYRQVWRVEERNNATNNLVRTWNKTIYVTANTFISIRNADGTCNRVCASKNGQINYKDRVS